MVIKTAIPTHLFEEANAAKLTLLKRGEGNDYFVYKLPCGHVRSLRSAHVRQQSFDCKQCRKEALEQRASAVGLEILGPGSGKDKKRMRFIACGHETEKFVSAISDSTAVCATCVEERRVEYAENANLTLIGKGRNKEYGEYVFNDCGHSQEITYQAVKKGPPHYACKTCQETTYALEAATYGLILLGPGSSNVTRSYLKSDCNHTLDLRPSHIKTGGFECKDCQLEEFTDIFKQAGLTLEVPGTRPKSWAYTCNYCGDSDEARPAHVKAGNFRCAGCLEQKHIAEAEVNNLELIADSLRPGYAMYQLKSCGHEQEIRIDAVRRNNFACHSCDESHLKWPASIYLAKVELNGISLLKLGKAKNFDLRAMRYGLPENAEITLLRVVQLSTGRLAQSLERKLHVALGGQLDREETSQLFTLSGSTECYPLSRQRDILNALAKLESEYS